MQHFIWAYTLTEHLSREQNAHIAPSELLKEDKALSSLFPAINS